MGRIFLSFDVETSGLPLFKEPSEHPDQPHIVQIGARLIDIETRVPVHTLDTIIKPDGWTIPDEVAAIHGITTERALAEGIPEHEALAAFDDMWRQAEFRLAYNASFDDRILRIAYMRHVGHDRADEWKDGAVKCSARMATPIVNMAPTDRMMAAGRYTAKMPKLAEAYRFFFGNDLENAHSALADVDASTAIYFACLDRAQPATTPMARPVPAPAVADEIRF
ncbi:3'-5' exonuclease [Kaistia algarum]|uniref:3'-5' exonuclease n=1 Tax=Kaistia algarum TaxID=2083279 RepID=UPI000CE77CD0|nr:3'-5' exonuclease [Kaistia algarum]MCX5516188.1 3'-5' exonuclease [Kaistia algarum]PPE78262.1 3'-5' exonuclease [Kaistia algarum]